MSGEEVDDWGWEEWAVATVAALEAEDGSVEGAARRLGITGQSIRIYLRWAGLHGIHHRIREELRAQFFVPPLAEADAWRVPPPDAQLAVERHRVAEMVEEIAKTRRWLDADPRKALDELLVAYKRVGGLWSLVAEERGVTPRTMKAWVRELRERIPGATEEIIQARLDSEPRRSQIRREQAALPPKRGSKRRGRPRRKRKAKRS